MEGSVTLNTITPCCCDLRWRRSKRNIRRTYRLTLHRTVTHTNKVRKEKEEGNVTTEKDKIDDQS